jgi:hypothetical protein
MKSKRTFNKMIPKPEKVRPRKDKKVLTMFIMIVPSLLIALTATIQSVITQISFQILLLFFQLVIFKNLLDNYYGDSEGDEE